MTPTKEDAPAKVDRRKEVRELEQKVADLVAENERLRKQIKCGHSMELDSLARQLHESQAREAKLRDGMDELAKLGMGESYGNSIGNCIARKYLELPSDDTALRELIAGVYEECAKACEDDAKSWTDYSCEMAAIDCADAIRALAEKAKGE